MTTYSEWTIIPADRKCDLPLDTKVQLMWTTEDVETAQESKPELAHKHCNEFKEWYSYLFAYRVVQEPVEEVREYACNTMFFNGASPAFYEVTRGLRCGLTGGKATQTTRDGKPYEFHWKASE